MPTNLKIERIFDAPSQLVWKAWGKPEMLKRWWGPKNWTALTVNIDFKAGGKYLLCMRGSMGPAMPETDIWSTGTYEEIVPLGKIVVKDSFSDENGNVVPASYYGLPKSFPLDSTIAITFEDIGDGKTKLTLFYPSIEGIEGKMLDNMTQGWNESLEKLAGVLK